MNWLDRVRAWGRSGIAGLGHKLFQPRRLRQTACRRPIFEQLETRLAPAVNFDSGSGFLSVMGDEAGPTDDTINVAVTATGFIEVSINGTVHSSDPASPAFDAALSGARGASIQSVSMQGLEGNDRLRLGDGINKFAGTHITLDGGAGADLVTGSALSESVIGGAGDDTIVGGLGKNTVDGGNGDDTLKVSSVLETEFVNEPGGTDTLDFTTFETILTIDLAKDAGEFQFFLCPGEDICGIAISGTIENLIGTPFDDAIAGNDANNSLSGGTGDDCLSGGQGNDSLSGGIGNDSLDGGPGSDSLVESADANITLTDTSLVGVGTDVVTAIEQATLTGGTSNNRIDASGFTGMATLDGGSGDDSLLGGVNNDILIGGSGNDQLVGGVGIDTADFSASATRVKVDLSRAKARGQGRDVLTGIENVVGTRFRDLLIGNSVANVLSGGDGNDTVQGGDGSDTLLGGFGNDRLKGGPGNDALDGGDGEDLLRGGPDDDTLSGGPGIDRLFGEAGFDRLLADGSDTITSVGPDGGEVIIS